MSTPLNAAPRITIGMPVFNGAATIAAAIEALLAQTFGNFELIVSDNASTDATRDVVEELKARDARILYRRQTTNVGANNNYSYLAVVARGEFLKWASASDWCAPTFLERCLALLARNADAVLAAPRTRLFTGERSSALDYAHDIEIQDATPSGRLIHLHDVIQLNNVFNGLIRVSALRRTRLIESYQQADTVLMGHLALLGKFLLVDEPLFYRRMEPATSTALQDEEAVRRHHYPEPTARALFQGVKRHVGWFRAAFAAPMTAGERLRLLHYLAMQLYWDRQVVAADLGGVWRYALARTAGSKHRQAGI